MTISTTVRKNYYEADGLVTVFPYTFKIVEAEQLKVYFEDASGNLALQTVGFTVSGVGNSGGGSVTFGQAPNGTTVKNVLLIRQTSITQSVDLVAGGKFGADVVETALDKLTCALQEIMEEASRAVTTRTQDGDLGMTIGSAEEGRALYWSGGILKNTPFDILALAAGTTVGMPSPSEGKFLQWSGGVLTNATISVPKSVGSKLYLASQFTHLSY